MCIQTALAEEYYTADGTDYVIRILPDLDSDASNPRENDAANLAELYTWSHSYNSPDSVKLIPDVLYPAVQQWAPAAPRTAGLVDVGRLARWIRVFGRDEILCVAGLHYGPYGELSVSADPSGHDQADGFAIITHERWRELMGDDYAGPVTPLEAIEQEAKSYTQWASGEVYGYTVETADGTQVDSCCGFLGDMDYVLSQAREALPNGAVRIED